jgi:hypothetical protein
MLNSKQTISTDLVGSMLSIIEIWEAKKNIKRVEEWNLLTKVITINIFLMMLIWEETIIRKKERDKIMNYLL